MKIFISWSGERSKHVALALKNWLPLVLHYVEPWISDQDIQAGSRWAIEVGKVLEISNFGILVLTKENLSKPWILFEAGALSKAFSAAAVCPLLVGVDFKDLTGPLSQFQAKKANENSLFELIETINNRSAAPVPSDRLTVLFGRLWPSFEESLSRIPEVQRLEEANSRTQEQVLEDLVQAVRRIEVQMNRIPQQAEPFLYPKKVDPHLSVIVEIEGDLNIPGVNHGVPIYLHIENDLVSEISKLLSLDEKKYGIDWFLREKFSNNTLSRNDALIGDLTSRRLARFILTDIPF